MKDGGPRRIRKFASIGRRDDTSANTTRFTSTSSEMAQHDGSAGVEDLPQDVTRRENVLKKTHIIYNQIHQFICNNFIK